MSWTPDLNTQQSIAALIEALFTTAPEVLGIDEVVSGCIVQNMDPYAVGVLPRYIRVSLRDREHQDVFYRGQITGLIVTDVVTVVHLRDGNRYEVLSAGGAAGVISPGAPINAQYVTMIADANLTQERILTPGAWLNLTDGGAGGNATIDLLFDHPVRFNMATGAITEYATIQLAINATVSGDIVLVPAQAVYAEALTVSGKEVFIAAWPYIGGICTSGAYRSRVTGNITCDNKLRILGIHIDGDITLNGVNAELSLIHSYVDGDIINGGTAGDLSVVDSHIDGDIDVDGLCLGNGVIRGTRTVAGTTIWRGEVQRARDSYMLDGLDWDDFFPHLFDDDGLLLINNDSDIRLKNAIYRWMTSRHGYATLTGAIHWEHGTWLDTRALVVEEATTNLILNPSFEINTAGWGAVSSAIARVTAYARFGEASLRVVTSNLIAAEGCQTTVTAQTAAATEYTLSAWVRGSGTVRLWIWDAGGGLQTGPVATLTDNWQRIEYTATYGGGAARSLGLSTNIQQNITFYCDGFQLEQRDYTTTYCDGTLGTGYAWTGAAHGSTSIRTVTLVNLDAYVGLVSGNNTTSHSFWVQMPYDANDPNWPTNPTLVSLFGGAFDRIFIRYLVADDKFHAYRANGAQEVASDVLTFDAGDWIHLVYTSDYTNDFYSLYINGILHNTDTAATAAPTITDWTLGHFVLGGNCGNFTFAEYAVFDRVLTADEVKALAAVQRPLIDTLGTCKSIMPLAYYIDVDNEIVYYKTPTGMLAIQESAAATVTALVYRNLAQAVGGGANASLSLTTETFDVGNNWVGGAPTRFTPSTAGYYMVGANVQWLDTVAGEDMTLWLMKNTTHIFASTENDATGTYFEMNVGGLIYLNGAGDFIEAYVTNGSAFLRNIRAAGANTTAYNSVWIAKVG